MNRSRHDPLLIRFLHHFNATRDYYACHDEMEELWLEEGRKPLYQGLLQVAVSLHHLNNGNKGGAIKLMQAAIEKLSVYPSPQLGLELTILLTDCRLYLARMQAAQPLAFYPLDITIVDPELLASVEAYS